MATATFKWKSGGEFIEPFTVTQGEEDPNETFDEWADRCRRIIDEKKREFIPDEP